MPSESRDVTTSSLYLRRVPDHQPAAYPGFSDSDGSGFSNSTRARDIFAFSDRPNARDFDTMLAAYLWSGGMARHQELATRLEIAGSGTAASLRRLIDSNAVFAFDWHGSLWLPMFQFEQPAMFVKPLSRRVLSELAGVFDGWSLATWYLQQNTWLHGRRPIDLLDSHPSAVVAAARGDRFIATDTLQRTQ